MNIKKVVSIAALAVSGLWVSQASAGVICDNCNYNQGQSNTYLGVHNAATSDFSTFINIAPDGFTGSFTNIWIFNITPAAQATGSADFDPLEGISGFHVTLNNVTATCTTVGGVCTGLSLGSMIQDGTDTLGGSRILSQALNAGMYAFVVTGTVNSTPVQYTGQVNTRLRPVPEPGSLALLGLGLVGMGLGRRRKAA